MPGTRPAEVRHHLALAGRDIPYLLRRSQRRSIGLAVDGRGLRVLAPSRARLGDIEKLLQDNAVWILDKLDHWQERAPTPTLQVEDGLVIFFAGQPLTVSIDPKRQRGHVFDPLLRTLTLNARQLPADALKAALQAEGRLWLAARLAHFAGQMPVPVPPLRLSSARTRWGSCNSKGQIALNWRLVFMPPELIDYVVIHELAHLKEMNHSLRFWSVVEQLCPDWQARRRDLRKLAHTLPEF